MTAVDGGLSVWEIPFGWRAYVAATATLAAIDGAFLGGVAAIITAVGGVVLGVLAFSKGKQAAVNGSPGDAVAEAWKRLAEERGREVRELRKLLSERRRHGGR